MVAGDNQGLFGRGALVVLATYNERANLPEVVARIGQVVPGADVLVVDDSSPDGTGDWVAEQAATNPRLRLLSRPAKQGIGSAVAAGLQAAIDGGYRWAINLDADLSHEPESIPDMLQLATDEPAGCDVVVGSRYAPGGAIKGWPLRRHLMSRGVNLLARGLLGLRVSDCSGSFRVYRTDSLARLPLASVESSGYAFFEEILWRLSRQGAKVGEVPIRFIERREGSSKISLKEIATALSTLGRLGRRHWWGPR